LPVQNVVKQASDSAVKAVEELEDPSVAVKELIKEKKSLKQEDDDEEEKGETASKESKKPEEHEEEQPKENKGDKVLKKAMTKNKKVEKEKTDKKIKLEE